MASGVRDSKHGKIVCQLCGALDKLMLCSRCRSVWYCCKEHQKYDWKYHKNNCKRADKITSESKSESSLSAASSQNATDVKVGMSAEERIIQPFMAASINDTSTRSSERDTGDVFSNSKTNKAIPADKNNLEHLSESKESSSSLNSNASSSTSSSDYEPETFIESGSSESYILETDSYSLDPSISQAAVHDSVENSMCLQNLVDARSVASQQAYLSACSVFESRNATIADYVVNCLSKYGICVVDGFLGESKGKQILNEVIGMHEVGMFTRGQLVNSETAASKLIRGDIITWSDGTEHGCDNIHFLISALDAIISKCAVKLDKYNINGRTKAMIACYPGCSTGYMRHVDNPNQDGRCITCIYYLNKNWDAIKDGGILRVYPEGQSRIASIEPNFDRLLFFWSDRRNPHEVMPAFKTRYAITVWYYDAEERRRAVKRFHHFKEKNNPKRIMLPLTTDSKKV